MTEAKEPACREKQYQWSSHRSFWSSFQIVNVATGHKKALPP